MAFEHLERPTGLVVITGTHSAGKTTLFNDLQDHLPKTECTNVAFSEEAATTYATTQPGKELSLTDGYTPEDQVIIEVNNFGAITEAVDSTQSSDDTHPGGLVISDRSPLDGLAYAMLRTGEDQRLVSMYETYSSAQNSAGNTVPGVFLPWAQWVSKFTQRYVDLVIIPDHTEVPFEDNGLRESDVNFREEVAETIARLYKNIVGRERILVVAGSREERLHIASLEIRLLARKLELVA